jgi:putative ABC transport system substrate-binding protein
VFDMKRREFIALLGGAVAWPLAARAQQAAMPVVGFLSSLSAPGTSSRMSSFVQGLSEIGFVVGKDAMIDVRMAEGKYDRLPTMAADLVNRHVSLIFALAPPAALAAKAATTSIPIVFVVALDPVKAGLVTSLSRPESNVTGITFISASLGAKRLELIRELIPNAGVIARYSLIQIVPTRGRNFTTYRTQRTARGSNCMWLQPQVIESWKVPSDSASKFRRRCLPAPTR